MYAAVRAEQQNRKSNNGANDDELLNTIKVSVGRLVFGEVIGIGISIMAGLGVAFNGFGVDIDLSMPLAVVIGAGASIVAAISGDILGAMLARYGNLRDSAEARYRIDYGVWEDGLHSSWTNSPDRQIARSSLKDMKAALKSGSVRSPNKRTNGSGKRDAIWAYLLEHSTDESIPGPTEVAEAIGGSKGYASEVITEFRVQHFTDEHIEEPIEAHID